MARYSLINAEEMAEHRPELLTIATRDEREALSVGDWALLGFEQPTGDIGRAYRERLWLQVQQVNEGQYIGGAPVAAMNIDLDDVTSVDFGPEHVIATR